MSREIYASSRFFLDKFPKISRLSRVLEVMYRFGQKTGYWFAKQCPQFRWQKDFYDHIVRREEEIEKHVRYVLNNPVRARLVSDWRDYPFKGSTVYDLQKR